jgi:hypothetical protein
MAGASNSRTCHQENIRWKGRDAWGSDWMKPEVLARYMHHGEIVTVEDGVRGVMRLPQPVEVQNR